MKKNNLNSRLKPLKIWEFREYSKGTLLENGLILNKMATFIYKLCGGDKTTDEIVELVLNNYKIDKKTAKTDIFNCIKELLAEKAIELK